MDKRETLLTQSPFRLMFQLCIPAIVGMVIIALYSFMDGVFAGQMIGKEAMAAVSIAYPWTFCNSGVATLIGIGSASVLSRAIGQKDKDTVDGIMGNLIVNVLLFSMVIMVLGTVFAKPLLSLSGASGEILDLAVRYLRVVLLGSFFVNFAQSANMVLRGEGRMHIAMGIMIIGAILNILLDPIMILAFGSRGIEGAAVATVFSQLITAGFTLYYFKKKSEVVRIGRLRIEKKIEKAVLSVGISAMMFQVLTLVQQTLLYRMAFHYGGDVQGILMGATLRIQAFSFIPLWGMAQGLQPVIGTNYGAKAYDRVQKVIRVFLLGVTALALIFWIPVMLFPEPILGLFIRNREIVTSGVTNFRIFYSVFPLYGAMVMTVTFFQSIGHGKIAGSLVLLRQIILFIPMMLLLPMIFGLQAVWYTIPLVEGLVIPLGMIILYLSCRRLPVPAPVSS